MSGAIMSDKRPLAVGDVLTYERSFTDEEVRDFARLTGDEGRHHRERDASGRLMVHGLLTAAIPTKLGGDHDYIAREMHFEFLRPVFVGDVIRCEMTITEALAEPGRTRIGGTCVCTNQQGKEVLRATTRGVIPNGSPR